MAELYRFFASALGDTRTYSQTDFARVTRKFIRTGYFFGEGNNLEVTITDAANRIVAVDTGQAWIEGYWYENDSLKALTCDTSASTRIDRVVIELDVVARTITAKILKGTDAATPTAPALTRTTTTYQISLYQINLAGTNIASLVREMDNTEVCGRAGRQGITLKAAKRLPRLAGEFKHYTDIAGSNRGVQVVDDDIYCIGGGATNCTKWSHATDTWAAIAALGTAVTLPGTCHYDGKIYAVGSSAGTTNKLQIYDIATNTWSTGTDIPAGGRYVVEAVDGNIYCWLFSSATLTLRIYNIATDAWSTGTDAPNIVRAICTNGTDIYLIDTTNPANLYRYIIATDSYASLSASPHGATHSKIFFDGKYIWHVHSVYTTPAIHRIAVYNITDNEWFFDTGEVGFGISLTKYAVLGRLDDNEKLAYLSDGRMVNPGGTTNRGTYVSKVWTFIYEIEDPATEDGVYTFRAKENFNFAFANHTPFSANEGSIAVQAGDRWGIFWGLPEFSPLTTGSTDAGDYIEIFGG